MYLNCVCFIEFCHRTKKQRLMDKSDIDCKMVESNEYEDVYMLNNTSDKNMCENNVIKSELKKITRNNQKQTEEITEKIAIEFEQEQTEKNNNKKIKMENIIPGDMDGKKRNFLNCGRSKLNTSNNYDNKEIIFQQIDIVQKSFYFLMFGVTDDGVSVCCRVLGYKPYLYYSMPKTFSGNENLKILTLHLNESIQNFGKQITSRDTICNIEIVEKTNIMYYDNHKPAKYLKITTTSTYAMKNFLDYTNEPMNNKIIDFKSLELFEDSIDFTIRFMCDLNIVGCCWIELPHGSWSYLHENKYLQDHSQTLCQLNIVIGYEKIIVHQPDDIWSRIAPLRILSFDIECAGRRGIFPQPSIDPIIQIANVVYLQGSSEPIIRNVFVLDTCEPIDGQDLLCFNNEWDMLDKWREFVLKVDPDLLTGYNILNFDLPYLLKRASTLKIDDFALLGRLINERSVTREIDSFSKQMGNRKLTFINITGRVIFDLYPILIREHKLRSFSLNAVSFHFLKEKKEDVHHSLITELHKDSSFTRRRLAIYCAKDAYLPVKLLNKLMCVINYIEMARVTGVPLTYLIMRGQQVKVFSQILRVARKKNLIIPSKTSSSKQAQFEGATVIEPKRGFYKNPIATLDFASLYPSIMIAHNLCFTTLVKSSNTKALKKLNLNNNDIEITPGLKHVFVKSSVKKGILPEILENLLEARKIAKQDLKNETDPQKKSVLDGRQLALKVSANSVYGFTGAQMGKLPCLPISSSVTAYGRQMIQMTQDLVKQNYKSSNIIYGDTDSVMVDFGDVTREDSMKMGKEAAALISKSFIAPIKLEFEKVYHPYLLINKKRYAGLLYTKSDVYDKIDCKGMYNF